MIASAETSMSASCVAPEVTDIRITQSPRHSAPAANSNASCLDRVRSPPRWSALAVAMLPKLTITWLMTTSLRIGSRARHQADSAIRSAQSAMALDEFRDTLAAPASSASHRPARRARGATVPAPGRRHPVALPDGRQVARPLRHGALVRLAVLTMAKPQS